MVQPDPVCGERSRPSLRRYRCAVIAVAYHRGAARRQVGGDPLAFVELRPGAQATEAELIEPAGRTCPA